jgi:hypothetical protein
MHRSKKNHVIIHMRYSDLTNQVHGGSIHRIKTCRLHTVYSPNHLQMLLHINIMFDHIKPHKRDYHSPIL